MLWRFFWGGALISSSLFRLYLDVYMYFYGFPSHIAYPTVSCRVPCALQWVLVDYFIKTSVHMFISTGEFLGAGTISYFSRSVRLFLFRKDVYLYPFLSSTYR